MSGKFSVEALLLDDTFIDYCQDEDSLYRGKWEDFAKENAEQQEIAMAAKAVFSLLHPALSTAEVTAEVDKLRSIMMADEHRAAAPVIPVKRRRMRFAYLAAASVLCMGFVWMMMRTNGTEKQVPHETVYASAFGERKELRLPDSSVVILNSGSSITLQNDFNKNRREVHLKGDAFFKVAKNAAKPFTVISGLFSTTALGTAFYVFGDAGVNGVDLQEGKVVVKAAASKTQIYLTPGEEATLNNEGKFVKNSFDTTFLQHWTQGKIYFDNTPVKQAFAELQRWYGVKISTNKKWNDGLTITGNYINQSLENVLKVICFTTKSHYTIDHNQVTIE